MQAWRTRFGQSVVAYLPSRRRFGVLDEDDPDIDFLKQPLIESDDADMEMRIKPWHLRSPQPEDEDDREYGGMLDEECKADDMDMDMDMETGGYMREEDALLRRPAQSAARDYLYQSPRKKAAAGAQWSAFARIEPTFFRAMLPSVLWPASTPTPRTTSTQSAMETRHLIATSAFATTAAVRSSATTKTRRRERVETMAEIEERAMILVIVLIVSFTVLLILAVILTAP